MPSSQTMCNNCNAALTDAEREAPGHGPRGTLLCSRCERADRAAHHGWSPVMAWGSDGEGLRVVAGDLPIPLDSPKVAFIRVTHDGTVETAHSWNGKRRMLERAAKDDLLMAAWPGHYRQSVFMITDRRATSRCFRPQR